VVRKIYDRMLVWAPKRYFSDVTLVPSPLFLLVRHGCSVADGTMSNRFVGFTPPPSQQSDDISCH
jgi:hypothetical protein